MHIEGSLGGGLCATRQRSVTSWIAGISALSLIATTVLTPWTDARAAGPLGPGGPVISPAPKASPVAPTPVIPAPQAPMVIPQTQAPASLRPTTIGTPTSSTGDTTAPTDKGNLRLPLSGIRVSAMRAGGGPTKRATTDGNGNVTFDKLAPGTYTFRLDPKSLASGAPVGSGPQETFIELLVVIFIIAVLLKNPDSSPTQSFVSETPRGQAVTFTATVLPNPDGPTKNTGSVTLHMTSGSGQTRASNFLPGNTLPATGVEFGVKSATGAVLPIKTDDAGNFTLGKLAPGKYTLDLGTLAKGHGTGNQGAPKLLVGLLLPVFQASGTASTAKNFSFISTLTTNALVLTVQPDGSVGSIDGGDGHPWKNADGAIVVFTDAHASRLGTGNTSGGDTASGITGTLAWAK